MREFSKNVRSRGIATPQAAAFWGVHYHTFRKLVRLGVIPGPIKLPGLARPIFDREQQEEAFNRFVECCLSKAKNWEAIRPILDRERNRVHHLNVNSTEKRRVEKARGPRSVNF